MGAMRGVERGLTCGVASLVMSHVQTWVGAVAVSDGIACYGARWLRRSLVSPASANTRYIVRMEARYVPRSSRVA
jgi:hypothetical protein